MGKFYIDESGKVYSKDGMDFRIGRGAHSGVGLTEVDQDYVDNMDAEKIKRDEIKLDYEWAKSELESSDIEIKYHLQGSKRARLTVQQWYDYQEELRDYATCDGEGNYSTLTDKPVKPE